MLYYKGKPLIKNRKFDVLEAVAKRGSFSDYKNRTLLFFGSNANKKDRVAFLKKEWGIGGMGSPCDKGVKNFIHRMNYSSKGIEVSYFNEDGVELDIKITYSQLADKVDALIKAGKWVE